LGQKQLKNLNEKVFYQTFTGIKKSAIIFLQKKFVADFFVFTNLLHCVALLVKRQIQR
jgi:hypothetical protein